MPRQENVRICPKCKSASWDTAKDGSLKPSGIKIEDRKMWLRVSDSYSAEQREQVEKQLDSFDAWLKRNDEGDHDA
jgi:hypothetical protein